MRFLVVCTLFLGVAAGKAQKIDKDCVAALDNFHNSAEVCTSSCRKECKDALDRVAMRCNGDSLLMNNGTWFNPIEEWAWFAMLGNTCPRPASFVKNNCNDAALMMQLAMAPRGVCRWPAKECPKECQATMDRLGRLCTPGQKFNTPIPMEDEKVYRGAETFGMILKSVQEGNPEADCMATGNNAKCTGAWSQPVCGPKVAECWDRNFDTCTMGDNVCMWNQMSMVCENKWNDIFAQAIACAALSDINCEMAGYCQWLPSKCNSDAGEECGDWRTDQCPGPRPSTSAKGKGGKGGPMCEVNNNCGLSEYSVWVCNMQTTEAECTDGCRWAPDLGVCLPTFESLFWCSLHGDSCPSSDSPMMNDMPCQRTMSCQAKPAKKGCGDYTTRGSCLDQDGCAWLAQTGWIDWTLEGVPLPPIHQEIKGECGECLAEDGGNEYKWFKNLAGEKWCHAVGRQEFGIVNASLDAWVNVASVTAGKGKTCSKGMAQAPMGMWIDGPCRKTPPSPPLPMNGISSTTTTDETPLSGGWSDLSNALRDLNDQYSTSSPQVDRIMGGKGKGGS